jgi:hypothetical protein
MLYHRTACTSANMCADSSGNAYLNGCSQGFVPFFFDHTGSMQVDCISFCKPADCYSGHCGASNANQSGDASAVPRHQCNTTDSTGAFDPASANCIYEWPFDVGANGLVASPTEDTVGYCIDNKFYFYDSSGGTAQCTGSGVPVPSCAQYPNCSTLPLMVATDNGINTAGDWGCVNHTIGKNGGMVPSRSKPHSSIVIDRPHPLYHPVARSQLSR